jgi:hypothetical protein
VAAIVLGITAAAAASDAWWFFLGLMTSKPHKTNDQDGQERRQATCVFLHAGRRWWTAMADPLLNGLDLAFACLERPTTRSC